MVLQTYLWNLPSLIAYVVVEQMLMLVFFALVENHYDKEEVVSATSGLSMLVLSLSGRLYKMTACRPYVIDTWSWIS